MYESTINPPYLQTPDCGPRCTDKGCGFCRLRLEKAEGGRGGVNLGEKEIAMQGAQSGSSKARDVGMAGYALNKSFMGGVQRNRKERESGERDKLRQADSNSKYGKTVGKLDSVEDKDGGGDTSMMDAEDKGSNKNI